MNNERNVGRQSRKVVRHQKKMRQSVHIARNLKGNNKPIGRQNLSREIMCFCVFSVNGWVQHSLRKQPHGPRRKPVEMGVRRPLVTLRREYKNRNETELLLGHLSCINPIEIVNGFQVQATIIFGSQGLAFCVEMLRIRNPEANSIIRCARTWVPNLYLTTYPFSVPADGHVPLNFLWQKCWENNENLLSF